MNEAGYNTLPAQVSSMVKKHQDDVKAMSGRIQVILSLLLETPKPTLLIGEKIGKAEDKLRELQGEFCVILSGVNAIEATMAAARMTGAAEVVAAKPVKPVTAETLELHPMNKDVQLAKPKFDTRSAAANDDTFKEDRS